MAPSRSLSVLLALVLAACSAGGLPSAATNPAPPVGAGVSPEHVRLGSALAQVRGHLAVSLALYEAGDQQGALIHAGHPIAEVLPAIRSDIAVDADALETALKVASETVDDKSPEDAVRQAVEAVGALTFAAEANAVGGATGSPSYRASALADLLATVAAEYEEAVDGTQIRERIEYQDAFGFLSEARRLYGAIEGTVRAASTAAADRIAREFATLAAALPGPEPPAEPTPIATIASAVTAIGEELTDALGALAVSSRDPAEVVREIERLLDQMLATYREGRVEEAAKIAATAYLDHYEAIEAAVIARAPAVNAELEPLLAALLRKRMREGAAVAEIETLVGQARQLLTQALAAISAP